MVLLSLQFTNRKLRWYHKEGAEGLRPALEPASECLPWNVRFHLIYISNFKTHHSAPLRKSCNDEMKSTNYKLSQQNNFKLRASCRWQDINILYLRFYAIQSSLCPSTCFPNPSSSSSGLRTLSKHTGYSPYSQKCRQSKITSKQVKGKPQIMYMQFFRFLELIRSLRNSITRPGGARLNRGSMGHTKSSSNQPRSRQSGSIQPLKHRMIPSPWKWSRAVELCRQLIISGSPWLK